VSCPVAVLEILAATRDERESSPSRRGSGLSPGLRSPHRHAKPHSGPRTISAPAADYLIAAAAAERGFGVLHADSRRRWRLPGRHR
jgi:hypothetical protein